MISAITCYMLKSLTNYDDDEMTNGFSKSTCLECTINIH